MDHQPPFLPSLSALRHPDRGLDLRSRWLLNSSYLPGDADDAGPDTTGGHDGAPNFHDMLAATGFLGGGRHVPRSGPSIEESGSLDALNGNSSGQSQGPCLDPGPGEEDAVVFPSPRRSSSPRGSSSSDDGQASNMSAEEDFVLLSHNPSSPAADAFDYASTTSEDPPAVAPPAASPGSFDASTMVRRDVGSVGTDGNGTEGNGFEGNGFEGNDLGSNGFDGNNGTNNGFGSTGSGSNGIENGGGEDNDIDTNMMDLDATDSGGVASTGINPSTLANSQNQTPATDMAGFLMPPTPQRPSNVTEIGGVALPVTPHRPPLMHVHSEWRQPIIRTPQSARSYSGLPEHLNPHMVPNYLQQSPRTPTYMTYPSSLQMSPGYQVSLSPNPGGSIFNASAPPPPATVTMPGQPQFNGQFSSPVPTISFNNMYTGQPAYNPYAEFAQSMAQRQPPNSRVPRDASSIAPPRMPHLSQQQQAFEGDTAGSLETGSPANTSGGPESYAEEASKYVQLQFAMTQRHGQACNLCKVRKIKCDSNPMGCLNCTKLKQKCLDLDRLTGQTVPRGHCKRLERKVRELTNDNLRLKRKIEEFEAKEEARNDGTDNDSAKRHKTTDEEPRLQLIHGLQNDQTERAEFREIIGELQRTLTVHGVQARQAWQALFEFIANLLRLRTQGTRPQASELEKVQAEIVKITHYLRRFDATMSDGKSFIATLRESLIRILGKVARLPAAENEQNPMGVMDNLNGGPPQ